MVRSEEETQCINLGSSLWAERLEDLVLALSSPAGSSLWVRKSQSSPDTSTAQVGSSRPLIIKYSLNVQWEASTSAGLG